MSHYNAREKVVEKVLPIDTSAPLKGTIPRTHRHSKHDWSGRVFSVTFPWPAQSGIR